MGTTARRSWRAASCLFLALAAAVPSPSPADEIPSCEGPGLEALARHLPEASRFVAGRDMLPAILALWPVDPALAARLEPDGATIFARDGRPLLVVLTRAGCLVGAFETDRAALWHRLRVTLGPAI